MTTITLPEAQSQLADLIHRLAPGDVVTITENDRPVARLIPFIAIPTQSPRPRPPITGVPKAGSVPGLIVPDDFKEPLEDMREYME